MLILSPLQVLSLIWFLQDLKEVSDPEEAKKRGMPKVPFKLLEFDFHLLKE